jgi:hypothetical protein
MKFREFIVEEKEKTTVFAFGRMNPPTTGHAKLVDKVHSLAKEHKADHLIVLSHSQDPAKNPLSPEQKLKHARRFFPKTKLTVATKDNPSFLSHAAKLHKEGTNHLVMVAGSDRIPEYEKLLHKYNGPTEKHLFNFKSVKVVSAGERDPDAEGAEGMSASKMRAHVKSNNFKEFRKGVPSHVSDTHAKELFNDVSSGMQNKPKTIREQYINGELFNIGDIVFVESREVSIIARNNNYVTVETNDGSIEKRWLDDISVNPPILEKKVEIVISPQLREKSYTFKTKNGKEIPRLLMTAEQIAEVAEKAARAGSQVSFMDYTTQNFDVESRAKDMFDDLINALGPVPAPTLKTPNREKEVQVQVGALVKPTTIRQQQYKQYTNI